MISKNKRLVRYDKHENENESTLTLGLKSTNRVKTQHMMMLLAMKLKSEIVFNILKITWLLDSMLKKISKIFFTRYW